MKNKDFCTVMLAQQKQKRSNRKDSTASLYRASCNHFIVFLRKKGITVLLSEVTKELVLEFVEWLEGKNLRVNSIISYVSNLRAMYNRACQGWKGCPDERPFEGILLKREDTVKRAVSADVINKLIELDLEDDPEKQLAVDIGLFSFLACGMPFVDIVQLTEENLVNEGKVLSYRRQKTGALIEMEISQPMYMLIERYRRPDSQYLFPILPEGATHEQYKYCLAKENRLLQEIQALLNLSTKLTTYVFRHSWASEAYHRNVPISIISQALGHSSEKMTRIYLSAFDADKVGEASRIVLEGMKMLIRT